MSLISPESSRSQCATTARPRRSHAAMRLHRASPGSRRLAVLSPSGLCEPRRRPAGRWSLRNQLDPGEGFGLVVASAAPEHPVIALLVGEFEAGFALGVEFASPAGVGFGGCRRHVDSKPCFQGGVNIVSKNVSECKASVAQELRRRADSYWRDVQTLRDEGDHNAVVIYRTIADELRSVADQLTKAD